MKIALVCPASLPATQFGGIVFLAVDLAREISNMGHDVTIYTTDLDFSNGPNKFSKKLILKEGLYRLALLATKKANSIFVIPIGIGYSKVSPNIRGKVSLCFEEPLLVNKDSSLSIKEFNQILNKRMQRAEKIALENVGR